MATPQTQTRPQPVKAKKPGAASDKPKTQPAAPPASTATTPSSETQEGYRKRLAKLPPHRRVAVKLANARARFAKIGIGRMAGWDKDPESPAAKAKAAFASVVANIDEAIGAIEAIPDDWKPAGKPAGKGKSASKVEIVDGTPLAITDKQLANYKGMLDDDAYLQQLKAKEVRGTRVLCETPTGEKLLINRGHLRVRPAEGPKTDEVDVELD